MWKSMPLLMKATVLMFGSIFALFALATVLTINEDPGMITSSDESAAQFREMREEAEYEAQWQKGPPASIYILVERELKKVAHDPGSIDAVIDGCVTTGGGPDVGWKVECQVRGRNAFGAKVLATQTAIINRVEGGYTAIVGP